MRAFVLPLIYFFDPSEGRTCHAREDRHRTKALWTVVKKMKPPRHGMIHTCAIVAHSQVEVKVQGFVITPIFVEKVMLHHVIDNLMQADTEHWYYSFHLQNSHRGYDGEHSWHT